MRVIPTAKGNTKIILNPAELKALKTILVNSHYIDHTNSQAEQKAVEDSEWVSRALCNTDPFSFTDIDA